MAEVCTVVVDVGSSSVKAGYAGDDIPCLIFPSVNQKYPPSVEYVEASGSDLTNLEFGGPVTHPVCRGDVRDWDQMEKLWNRIMETIGIDKKDTASVFITESPRATVADRMKWGELLFETNLAPSICIGSSAPLSLFASGRTTGLVVECGAGLTSVVPVFEGLSLTHAAICMEFGGQDITSNFRKILTDHNYHIDFNDARMLKEKMAEVYVPSVLSFPGQTANYVNPPINYVNPPANYVSPPVNYIMRSGSGIEMKQFELPDGTQVSVPKQIFTDCTEPLFRNERIPYPAGLIAQVYDSLRLCDDSIRKDLAYNIVVAGGTSLLPGLSDRLMSEVQQRVATDQKTKGNQTVDIRVVPNSKYW